MVMYRNRDSDYWPKHLRALYYREVALVFSGCWPLCPGSIYLCGQQVVLCRCRLMDKSSVYGTEAEGSTPSGGTMKLYKIKYVYEGDESETTVHVVASGFDAALTVIADEHYDLTTDKLSDWVKEITVLDDVLIEKE